MLDIALEEADRKGSHCFFQSEQNNILKQASFHKRAKEIERSEYHNRERTK